MIKEEKIRLCKLLIAVNYVKAQSLNNGKFKNKRTFIGKMMENEYIFVQKHELFVFSFLIYNPIRETGGLWELKFLCLVGRDTRRHINT